MLFRSCPNLNRAQAGGGELLMVPQSIIDMAQAQAKQATKGRGGMISWPGMLRRLDRRFPGYDQ